MKLTIRLQIDEANSRTAELELTDKDMKNHEQLMKDIALTFTAVRSSYMELKHGPRWYEKEYDRSATLDC